MSGEVKIREYLLGRLGDAERDSLEERLIAEADFHSAVRDAEYDLYDEYSSGRMSTVDRAAFEKRRPVAIRIRTARLLTKRTPPSRSPLISILAACLALSAGINGWLLLRAPQKAVENPVVPASAGPQVVTVELSTSGERSVTAGPVARVRRPKDGEMVRLRFTGFADGLTISAEVVASAGVVWKQTVPVEQGRVEVWLPGAVLRPGSYEVSLRAGERLVGFSELRVEE